MSSSQTRRFSSRKWIGPDLPEEPILASGGAHGEGRSHSDSNSRQRRPRPETSLVGLMQKVAATFNRASSVYEAPESAVGAICGHAGWEVGHAYLPSPNRGELKPAGIWYPADSERFRSFRQVTERTCFMPGEGMVGRVLASGKPAWIEDVTKDPGFVRCRSGQDIGVRTHWLSRSCRYRRGRRP